MEHKENSKTQRSAAPEPPASEFDPLRFKQTVDPFVQLPSPNSTAPAYDHVESSLNSHRLNPLFEDWIRYQSCIKTDHGAIRQLSFGR